MESNAPQSCESKFRHAWLNAFDVARAFTNMQPLYAVGRLLSLNAASACKRLGEQGRALNVIMLEVGNMTVRLSELVDEVQASFHELMQVVGAWIQDAMRLQATVTAMDMTRAREHLPAVGNGAALDGHTLRQWTAMASRCKSPVYAPMWRTMLTIRARIVQHMADMEHWVRNLSSKLDRISLVATRQSKYLATMAKVEVGRIAEGEVSLSTLVTGVDEFATKISAIENQARLHLDHLDAALASIDCNTQGVQQVA